MGGTPGESRRVAEGSRGQSRMADPGRGVDLCAAVVWGIIAFGAPALAAEKGDAARGQALYVEYCSQCHGGRGEGWGWGEKIPPPPVPIPDLSNAEHMRQLSDQYLFEIIKEGGEAVGKMRLMPAAGRVMNDGAIWDVIAYLRSLSRRVEAPRKQER